MRRSLLPVDLLVWPLPVTLLGVVLVTGDYRSWTEVAFAVAVVVVAVPLGHGRQLPAIALVLLGALWLRELLYVLPALGVLAGLRLPRTTGSSAAIAALSLLALAATAVLTGRSGEMFTWSLLLLGALIFPYLVGRFCRQYGELVRSGWERAEQLEREQRILAEQERLRERARIAEDMHDQLGHELSLIAMRAGVLEVTSGLDESEYQSAAAQLRTDAAHAAEVLQEIIGILDTRPDPAESGTWAGAGLESGPGMPVQKTIAALVEQARAVGQDVELRETSERGEPGPGTTGPWAGAPDDNDGGGTSATGGTGGSGGSVRTGSTASSGAGTGPGPGPDGRAAPPSRLARSAAYRVVQEALTNAAKHAPGAPVRVAVRTGPLATTVTVASGPPADHRRLRPQSGGRGLVRLRERVRVAGGTLDAGPRDNGFTVTAHLPHTAPAHPPKPEDPPHGRSAQQREHAQRQLRRDLVTMIATPIGLATALALAVITYVVFAGANSVLSPAAFDRLRVGQSRASVEAVLPRMEMADAPADRSEPAPPRGSACRMYRSHTYLSGSPAFAHRLCFADGRLVAKDAIPLGALPYQ